MKTTYRLLICATVLTLLMPVTYAIKSRIQSDKRVITQTVSVQPIVPILPQPPPKLSLKDAVATVTEKDAKFIVTKLTCKEYEGRKTGGVGQAKAAKYIRDQFTTFDLPTMYDDFKTNGGTGRNVYAWIEGTDSQVGQQVIVVGAHYDHLGQTRSGVCYGADDNASGTTGMMLVAKSLAKIKSSMKRTIVFQAYSGEEQGLLGSQYYCAYPKFPKDAPDIKAHIFMLNLDMIGHLRSGTLAISTNDNPDIRGTINKLSSKYPFASSISAIGSGGGASDQASFYKHGISVVFLHTGMHRYYHTPADTSETLNFRGMEAIAKYAVELVYNIDHAESKPLVNRYKIKSIQPLYDHNDPRCPFFD